jgi:hypothetical protein
MIVINDAIVEAKKKGYYVDNDGNVFSKRNQLKLQNRKNYLHFSIRYFGERIPIKVHRFVAYMKYGNEMFNDGIVIRHFDGNSLNNSWENILIGTLSQNTMDIPKENRIKTSIRNSSVKRKFNDDEVSNIIKDRNSGYTYNELCEKYSTSKSTLSYFFNDAYYSGAKKL